MNFAKHLALGIALGTCLCACSSGPPFATATGEAPAHCKTDAGYTPAPLPGKWAIVLNFNHAASASNTLGCIVRQATPGAFTYTDLNCPIVGNRANVQIGGGSAKFDRALSINCALGEGAPTVETQFVMHGTLSFGWLPSRAEVLRGTSFGWRIDPGGSNWRITSTYEGEQSSTTYEGTHLPGTKLTFTSALAPGRFGNTHTRIIAPLGTSNSIGFGLRQFTLQNTGTLLIGQNASFELHDLMIGVVPFE